MSGVSNSAGGGVSGVPGVGGGSDDTGVGNMVGVGNNGRGNGLLVDGLSLDRGGDGDVVGGVNVDGGGHGDDVILVHGHVVGHLNATLHHNGVLDVVDLDLLLHDGGVVGNGSPQDGGDGDGKMGGGGLKDPGGVAGHVAGLSEVDLLGDDGGGLVHGGNSGSLGAGGEGSGGSGSHVVDGVGDHGAGLQGVGGQGSGAHGLGDGSVGQASGTGVSQAVSGEVLGSRAGAGHQEGKCDKGPHVDWSLPLSW